MDNGHTSTYTGPPIALEKAKKIYIERRPSFFAFAGIGTKMKKMRGILR
jgi:hypothetical protein